MDGNQSLTTQPESVLPLTYAPGACDYITCPIECVNCECSQLPQNPSKTKLLVCYQCEDQQEIMRVHGNILCLDSTHKSNKHKLPLFLLVCRTPHGYQVCKQKLETFFPVTEKVNKGCTVLVSSCYQTFLNQTISIADRL